MRFSLFLLLPILCFVHCISPQFAEIEEGCPRQAPAIKDPKAYQTCYALIEKKLKFDKSFSTILEAQVAKRQLIEDITDIFFTKLKWPENNRLLVFPNLEFTHEQVCLFAPERDPKGCHFHPKPGAQIPTLSYRLVSYLLTHIRSFVYQSDEFPTKNATTFVRMVWPLGRVHVYPVFFRRPWVDQVSSLLHEAKHDEWSNSRHINCSWIPIWKEQKYCDADGKGSYGMGLLFPELVLQAQVQDNQEEQKVGKPEAFQIASQQNQEDLLASSLFYQCKQLHRIQTFAPLTKEFRVCHFSAYVSFVQNHPLLFGFP